MNDTPQPPLITEIYFSNITEIYLMDLLILISCFQAKRALRALRGLVRLKSLMEGPVVKRQAASTLRCMQTLSRVQCQIRTRRIRMTEENQALQRQLLQKHAKELVNLQVNPLFL